jgi:hypothetical protein
MSKKKPYLKLSRVIEDAGFDRKELAAAAGIGESTLSMRMNSASCAKGSNGNWRKSEIVSICCAAGIPRAQIGELFFPEVNE